MSNSKTTGPIAIEAEAAPPRAKSSNYPEPFLVARQGEKSGRSAISSDSKTLA
jgi:hypothetical protein